MRVIWRTLRLMVRAALILAVAFVLLVVAGRWITPPMTVLMVQEHLRLGQVDRTWASRDRISPHLMRAAIAGEDAQFCAHFGFDMEAIQEVLESGQSRGASTISQQVAKNAYLWPARSWLRKGAEAGVTLIIEATWPKARIMEVYLNVAEMGEGVFGAEAAAWHWYGVPARDLSLRHSAQLVAILPNPRARDPRQPPPSRARRVAQIMDGAETVRRDGRAACIDPA
jgi:monofunctional biosynthetic peptidoglycan transglycosylase